MTISIQIGNVGLGIRGEEAALTGEEFASGYREVESEVQAVQERDLIPVNVDVPSAVATVLGSLPEIQALRDELGELPGFDLKRFSRLRLYALALGHAHAVYRAASGPNDRVAELSEQVARLRDVLHADATALAKRGLLDKASVAKLRSGQGYKNLAFDVASLVSLFRDNWPAVAGRTAVQPAELEVAGELARQLIDVVGLREQAPAAVGAAALVRQKAFTLVARVYDDARRAVTYLRWHQRDADSIAPSLYAGRNRSSKAEAPAAPPAGPEPVLGPVGAGADTPAAPDGGVAAPPGFPGASPFARG